jgi:hypothetical protein
MRGGECHSGSHSPYSKRWRTAGGGALLRLGVHPIGAMLHLKRQEGLRRSGRPIRPRTVVAELIVQSAYGAALMLRESADHPVLLREAVTSPAGTTIAAIRELERHGVRAALLDAIEAARDRSVELGRAAQQG